MVYVVSGPLAWVALFAGTLMGRVRMGRLLRWRGALPENPPEVTILIPAKDEQEGIAKCIEAVLGQDYPHFRIIAIDDRSQDRTGAILDEIARRDGRLSVIHVGANDLPEGWLGKCHALHVAAKQAGGEWFLFVDSDVVLAPDALSRAASMAIQRKYDALSILTKLDCRGFVERLMLPVLAGAWAVMHTISWTNEDSRTEIAAANGQFFLIRREAYEAVGGHEAVKARITEDVELMRRLKGSDFRVRFFMGWPLATTRMHANLGQMFNGWGRIYSGTSRRRPWRILGAMAFVVLSVLSVYPALGWGAWLVLAKGGWAWMAASAAHGLLLTAYLAMIYRWSGNRARYALLAGLAGSLLLAILGYSLRKCRTGRITWRGTEFAAGEFISGTAPLPERQHPGGPEAK